MGEKIITLFTPSYNKAPYIQNWARGLAKQTYLDKMKILVTDDGSTDDSLALIKKFAEEYNLPVEITENGKNLGLMPSTLSAYRKIDTKYFAVLDADDYYISSQKIEKAVEFLEKNPDYSCYACNSVNIYPNNERRIAFAPDMKNQTFIKPSDAPFFQTASTTFRNFFDTKLLDAIDEFTEGHRKHAFQGDGFRNILAFHFGKVYFENSPDCAWLKEIGIWGTTSKLSQKIASMKSFNVYFKFFMEQFGYDDIAQYCLDMSLQCYRDTLDLIHKTLDNFVVAEFRIGNNFNQISKFKDEADKIFAALVEQYEIFAEMGLKINLSKKI